MNKYAVPSMKKYPINNVHQLSVVCNLFDGIKDDYKMEAANNILEQHRVLNLSPKTSSSWYQHTNKNRVELQSVELEGFENINLTPSEVEPKLAEYVTDDVKHKLLQETNYFDIMEKYREGLLSGRLQKDVNDEILVLRNKLKKVTNDEDADTLTAYDETKEELTIQRLLDQEGVVTDKPEEDCIHEGFFFRKKPNLTAEEIKKLKEQEKEIKQKCKSGELMPVYIVLSGSDWLLSKIIRAITSSKYSHASVTLFADLKPIIGFANTKRNNGIQFEDPFRFLDLRKPKFLRVMSVFIPTKAFEKMHEKINYIRENPNRFKYNSKLYNVVLGKGDNEKANKEFDLDLYCSEFVHWLFKQVNVDIIENKPIGLTTPGDFVKNVKGKIALVYEGLTSDFDIMGNVQSFEDKLGVNKLKYKRSYRQAELIEAGIQKELFEKTDNNMLSDYKKTTKFYQQDKSFQTVISDPSINNVRAMVNKSIEEQNIGVMRIAYQVISNSEFKDKFAEELDIISYYITTQDVAEVDKKTTRIQKEYIESVV